MEDCGVSNAEYDVGKKKISACKLQKNNFNRTEVWQLALFGYHFCKDLFAYSTNSLLCVPFSQLPEEEYQSIIKNIIFCQDLSPTSYM